jgi:hypothetical protein
MTDIAIRRLRDGTHFRRGVPGRTYNQDNSAYGNTSRPSGTGMGRPNSLAVLIHS